MNDRREDIDVAGAEEGDAARRRYDRYETILAGIADAVISTDGERRVDFMNPVAERLTGWSLEKAKGRPISEVFRVIGGASPADGLVEVSEANDDQESSDSLEELSTIPSRQRDGSLRRRDGSTVAIESHETPLRDEKGGLVGAVTIFRDITQRRLEERRRRFMAEASATLSSSLDHDQTLRRVPQLAVPEIADWCAVDVLNPATEQMERVTADHLEWSDDLSEDIDRLEESSVYGPLEVIRTGRSQLLQDVPDELKDRETGAHPQHLRMASLMIVPLLCRGRALGAISFVSSDSGRKFGPPDLALAEELSLIAAWAIDNARLYREAHNANKIKDEFLAAVSHELRTPLNAILGWANLLRTAEMSEERKERAYEVIARNASIQGQLVEDLLDVSRIITGDLRLELSSIDLGTIVRAAVDLIRTEADRKDVNLQVSVEDAARPGRGDADRIQQVVWNLLSNAMKFTNSGGCVKVELLQKDHETNCVRVSDTGRGISKDELPYIFDGPIQDTEAETVHEGIGLGLAIVKHLTELHGGAVSVTSPGRGQGATFEVQLPMTGPVGSHSVTPMPSELPTEVLDGLHVLVVDDEAEVLEQIVDVLEEYGAVVSTAGSAAQGLQQLAAGRPDIVLCDIGMPEEDGYTFIRKARAMRRHTSQSMIPAAALTRSDRMVDRTRAMMAGFQSHVAKPLGDDELVLVVAALAGRTGRDWTLQSE